MTKPTRLEINCTTGVETIHDLTDEEIAQNKTDAAARAIELAEQEAEATAKAEAKERGDAKLLALGLTAEEIAAR
jgi:hypothetical protein